VAVQTTPVKSLPIATPVSVPVAVPVLAETPRDVNDVPANAIVEPATSPIHDLLHSLKKKDALTTAFLLNEILGPPVSKRKRA